MTDLSYMDKIKTDNVMCPNCGSHDKDILALSSVTCIFMCRQCHESFGLKWLSKSDIEKVKQTAEYKARHSDEVRQTSNGVTIRKKPWLRV